MSQVTQLPEWMVEKTGNLVFSDADFTNLDFKYGQTGAGGGSIGRVTNHVFGGPGAVEIITGPLVGNTKALVRNIPYVFDGTIVAFECKFIHDPTFAGNQYEVGFRLLKPAVGIIEGHVVYDQDTDTVMFQDGNNSFTPFTPVLNFPPPNADGAPGGNGDDYGWIRVVVDIDKLEFVSCSVSGENGKETRDMEGIPMVNIGPTTNNRFIVRNVTVTQGAGAVTSYSTDWAVTAIG